MSGLTRCWHRRFLATRHVEVRLRLSPPARRVTSQTVWLFGQFSKQSLGYLVSEEELVASDWAFDVGWSARKDHADTGVSFR